MADHLAEQEQIEEIKKWWNQNWATVVFPLLAIVIAYGGWSLWQDYRETQAIKGSDAYQEILAKFPDNGELKEPARTEVREMAKALVESQKSSLYGDYAQLLLAKFAVEDGELEQAQSYLKQVVAKPANDSVAHVARARLARIALSLDAYDEALEAVSSASDEAFNALFAEIRGDIYLEKGNKAAAKEAYQTALVGLDVNQFARRSIIQIKLDNAQVLAATESAPSKPAAKSAPAEPIEEQASDETEATEG